ncbi:MAG: hypothetical protein ABIF71_14820 [Planctomycetota bacterium]
MADAIAAERHDPAFAARVLADHNVRAYVTSIENRDRIPAAPVRPGAVDLASELVSAPYSAMYRDVDAAGAVMRDMLYNNPAAVHHIPVG